jgi:hypothetical protein
MSFLIFTELLKLTCDYNNLQLYVDHLWALYTFKTSDKNTVLFTLHACIHSHSVNMLIHYWGQCKRDICYLNLY